MMAVLRARSSKSPRHALIVRGSLFALVLFAVSSWLLFARAAAQPVDGQLPDPAPFSGGAEDSIDDATSSGGSTVQGDAEDDVAAPPATPRGDGRVFFFESFQDGDGWLGRWKRSSRSRYTGEFDVIGRHRHAPVSLPKGERVLRVTQAARHYALSTALPKDVVAGGPGGELVLQYEVRFAGGVTCSGAYVKLIAAPFGDLEQWEEGVPYSVMFGPDRCGATTDKVHLIFQSRNPRTEEYLQHHLVDAPSPPVDEPSGGHWSHLYTLHVSGDSFSVRIDGEVVRSGQLSAADDFDPPLEPPLEVVDPDDSRPLDWVTEREIDDPEAVKPDDWDDDAPATVPDEAASKPEGWLEEQPPLVPDPAAARPAEWDDEEDGEWVAPMVANPACEGAPGCGPWQRPTIANPRYRGRWAPPKVPNPAYVGEWTPRKIPNPEYYEAPAELLRVSALGFELWVMDENILFDNILLTDDIHVAENVGNDTFVPKRDEERKLGQSQKTSTVAKAKGDRKTRDLSEPILFVLERVLGVFERLLRPLQALVERLGLQSQLARVMEFGDKRPVLVSSTITAVLFGLFLLQLPAQARRKERRKLERARKARAEREAATSAAAAPSAATAAAAVPAAATAAAAAPAAATEESIVTQSEVMTEPEIAAAPPTSANLRSRRAKAE